MQTYSFENIVMIVNNVPITGWMDGDDLITVERRVESGNLIVGGDGAGMLSISPDKSGTITFRLKQTAPANLFLSQLVNDMQSNNYSPIDVMIKDVIGTDLVNGTKGFIEKPADIVRGINGNAAQWVIVSERLTMVQGNANFT